MTYEPMRWRICAEQPDWDAEMLEVEPDPTFNYTQLPDWPLPQPNPDCDCDACRQVYPR